MTGLVLGKRRTGIDGSADFGQSGDFEVSRVVGGEGMGRNEAITCQVVAPEVGTKVNK